MLDEQDTSTPTPASGDDSPPPAKRAPRRRASKAAAAPVEVPADAPVPAEAPAAAAPADSAPDSAPAADAAPEEAPKKRAPRKRATKKAAPAEAPAEDTAAAPTAEAATEPAAEAATEPAEAPAAAEEAPRKRAPRKRAAKKAAPAEVPAETSAEAPADEPTAEQAAEALAPGEPVVDAVEDEDEVAEAAAQDTTAPAEEPAAQEPAPRTRRGRAPAVVTFVAPDEVPSRPARRSRKAAAAPAAGEAVAPAADAAAGTPAEAAGTASDAEPAAEAAPTRRRRRASTRGAVAPDALLSGAATTSGPVDAAGDEPAAAAADVAAEAADEEAVTGSADAEDADDDDRPRRRRRGRRGRGRRSEEGGDETAEEGAEPASAPAVEETDETAEEPEDAEASAGEDDDEDRAGGTRRRRRRRRRSGGGGEESEDDVPTVVHVREPREKRVRGAGAADEDGVRGITGSTRIAAKRVRRQEGRDSGRRRAPVLTEAEFLARRESVERHMVVRQKGELTQIAVLEDGVLVEHYVTKATATSYAGNVYLGKVQNVLPSMEAAFVDIGKGRNGVLYAGEVNFEGAGTRKIEAVLKSGQDVLVQVSKDPIGHKGARLTSQISLPGRYLVYVPEGSMTGISRKLPDTERSRLKAILKKVVPENAGVIIRTAAEGASEEELAADVARLQGQWEEIQRKAASTTKSDGGGAPKLLHGEPDLVVRVVRDVFNEDFTTMTVSGDQAWATISDYVASVAPDLAERVKRHTSDKDVFGEHRIDEQLLKALDRKVHLPSGGSLVIDRTEAMIVIDVNTGKFVGKGGNLEAAEEIARQLRLRDLGGIIVVDFIDMVLESNRDLVVRRLVECMGRDRTKHQVAEVTSLGLVQMTRKRVGQGLLEAFSETCESCGGRGVHVRHDGTGAPVGGARSVDGGVGIERVAKALHKDEKADEKADEQADEAPAGASAAPDAEDADEAPRPRRRRRGGRGSGAATVAPQDEMGELLAEPAGSEVPPPPHEGDEPDVALVDEVADAPAVVAADPAAASSPTGAPAELAVEDAVRVPVVEDRADERVEDTAGGGESLPAGEAAEQPTPAEEDQPVLPDVLASVTDPEPEIAAEPDPEPVAPVRRRRRAARPAAAPDA